MKRLHAYLVLALVVFLVGGIAPAFAQEDPPFEDPTLEEAFQLPGTVEGSGTSFEITDSEYLNVTLESSQPVKLWMESVPETVTLCIEAADGATSAQITLSGLSPSTTYYKYEDDLHNLVTVTTDATGVYTYNQDLSQPHLIFVQTRPSTIFIPSDTTVGTWNPATRKYKLTMDVDQAIQIDEDNLTLDGAGYSVTGFDRSSRAAVFVPAARTGVTIQNLTINSVYGSYDPYGRTVYVLGSNNTLIDNTVNGSIMLGSSYGVGNNTVTRNTVSGARVFTVWSNENVLTNNTLNDSGITVRGLNNTLADNVVYGGGIGLSGTGTLLTGNTLFGSSFSTKFGSQTIDTSNTIDGRPIWYVENVNGAEYDASTNAAVFIAFNCSNLRISGLTPLVNHGIHLNWVNNSTIANNVVEGSDISVYGSSGNILTGNIQSSGFRGISLSHCSVSTLDGNTTSNNEDAGIYVANSSRITLMNNSALSNRHGISLWWSSDAHKLTGNTMAGNSQYNFFLNDLSNAGTLDIDTTNLVDDRPIWYVKNVIGPALYDDASTNAGAFYAVNCSGITIEDLVLTKNSHGVCLVNTTGSTVQNVLADNNETGIELYWSDGNTLTNNRISNSESKGIYVFESGDNDIYNNSFFGNLIQARESSVHVLLNAWNLVADQGGGNFWDNWTSPDADGDWFVDYPYEVTRFISKPTVYDYLPWAIPDGWKATPQNVSAGSGVTVSPTDPNTGVSVSLTFDNVTVAGETMVTTSELEGVMDPPDGYRIGASNTLYFIETTAEYSGSIWLQIPYAGPPADLYHYENGAWVLVAANYDGSPVPVSSLSPFALFEVNTVPMVDITAPSSGQLLEIGQEFTLEGVITDPDDYDWHTATWNVASADGLTDYDLVGTVDGALVTNTLTLRRVGIYSIALSVTDSAGETVDASTVYPDDLPAYVVVYDPDAGHVTGGGWIYSPAGALDYGFDPAAEGKATFGFVAKYEQGATAPTGNTEFNFHAGGLKFTSTSYDWLVVAGTKAQFKGEGSIAGLEGSYKFMLTAVDGGADDRFRIKIWDPATDIVVYDNKRGFDDNTELDSSTMIGGGSIIVHSN